MAEETNEDLLETAPKNKKASDGGTKKSKPMPVKEHDEEDEGLEGCGACFSG